jgi:hypothetical protein
MIASEQDLEHIMVGVDQSSSFCTFSSQAQLWLVQPVAVRDQGELPWPRLIARKTMRLDSRWQVRRSMLVMLPVYRYRAYALTEQAAGVIWRRPLWGTIPLRDYSVGARSVCNGSITGPTASGYPFTALAQHMPPRDARTHSRLGTSSP